MNYGRTVALDMPLKEAVEAVKTVFAQHGLETIGEFDVQRLLRDRLGKEVGPYVVLETCDAEVVAEALEADPDIGLLIPCNVVLRERGAKTLVRTVSTQALATIPQRDRLDALATEVGERMSKALDDIVFHYSSMRVSWRET